jgi:hypothetical protein
MTGSLITPIIPGAAGQGEPRPAVRWGVVRARRRLPLGQLSTGRIGTAVYGMTALDSHGRIADRAVLRALDWTPGVRLDIATRDLVTMRVHADGVAGGSGVTPQGHVRLPAPVRHLCGLRAGDRVLLAAEPSAGVLRVFPPATVDALLSALTSNPDDDQNFPSNPAGSTPAGGGTR